MTLAAAAGFLRQVGAIHPSELRAGINGRALQAGDALKLEQQPELRLAAGQGAEVLVFDLP